MWYVLGYTVTESYRKVHVLDLAHMEVGDLGLSEGTVHHVSYPIGPKTICAIKNIHSLSDKVFLEVSIKSVEAHFNKVIFSAAVWFPT